MTMSSLVIPATWCTKSWTVEADPVAMKVFNVLSHKWIPCVVWTSTGHFTLFFNASFLMRRIESYGSFCPYESYLLVTVTLSSSNLTTVAMFCDSSSITCSPAVKLSSLEADEKQCFAGKAQSGFWTNDVSSPGKRWGVESWWPVWRRSVVPPEFVPRIRWSSVAGSGMSVSLLATNLCLFFGWTRPSPRRCKDADTRSGTTNKHFQGVTVICSRDCPDWDCSSAIELLAVNDGPNDGEGRKWWERRQGWWTLWQMMSGGRRFSQDGNGRNQTEHSAMNSQGYHKPSVMCQFNVHSHAIPWAWFRWYNNVSPNHAIQVRTNAALVVIFEA